MKIITSETRNPTPNRALDWQATIGSYDEGDFVGYGATPELATAELLERVADNVNARTSLPPTKQGR